MTDDDFCGRYFRFMRVDLFENDRAIHADAPWTGVETFNRRSRTERDDGLLRIVFLRWRRRQDSGHRNCKVIDRCALDKRLVCCRLR